MRLETILTLLLVGSTSAALAQPVQSWGDRRWEHRGPGVLIADDLRMSGLRSRPVYVELDPWAEFRALRFELDYGTTYIDTIVVEYASGQRQVLRVQEPLTPANPSIVVELPFGGAAALWIYGTQMRGAVNRAGGAVDLIGLR